MTSMRFRMLMGKLRRSQLFHGGAKLARIDVDPDLWRPGAGEQHELDGTLAAALLVAGRGFDDRVEVNVGEGGRETVADQELAHLGTKLARSREPQGRQQPEPH